MSEPLLREIIKRLLSEAKGDNLASAMEVLASLGLGDVFARGNQIRIEVPRKDRNSAMSAAIEALEPLGFEYTPTQTRSSLGHISLMDRTDGNVYVVVKPVGGGSSAAGAGLKFENEVASFLQDNLSNVCKVETAGFGHGSDVMIHLSCADGRVLGVETKSGSGADFGQFSIEYDPAKRKWQVINTENYRKQKGLVDTLWKSAGDIVNQKMTIDNVADPHFRKKGGLITGLIASPTTGEFRKSLEDVWFNGKSSLNIPVDFKNVTGYYKSKGDDIIQIGSLGAWALQSEFKALGMPMFDDVGATARLRIRIKPSMGADGSHRFNVGIKVSGLGRSKFSLLNPKDIAKLDDFFTDMQESVSRSTIRNAILEVANQFRPAQDAPRNIALRLLEEHGIEIAMNIAARDGNFAVLKILMDFGPDSASDVRHFPFGRM